MRGHRGLQPTRETSRLASRVPWETRRSCEVPAPRQRPQHCQRPLLTLSPLHVFFSWDTRIQHSRDTCQWGDCPASEYPLPPPASSKSSRVQRSTEQCGACQEPRAPAVSITASFQPKGKSRGQLLTPSCLSEGLRASSGGLEVRAGSGTRAVLVRVPGSHLEQQGRHP